MIMRREQAHLISRVKLIQTSESAYNNGYNIDTLSLYLLIQELVLCSVVQKITCHAIAG